MDTEGLCHYCGNNTTQILPMLVFNLTYFQRQDICFFCNSPIRTLPRVPRDWPHSYICGSYTHVHPIATVAYFQPPHLIQTLLPTGSVPPVRSQGNNDSNLDLQYADLVACQFAINSRSPVFPLSSQDIIENARYDPLFLTHADASGYFRNVGVCFESDYAHVGNVGRQRIIPRVKVREFRDLHDPTFDNVCEHINTVGSLLASIVHTNVFETWGAANNYNEQGVYSHVHGGWNNEPLHALLVVGYDKGEGALMVKNTYGIDWGCLGFLKVKFESFMNRFIYPSGVGISPYSG